MLTFASTLTAEPPAAPFSLVRTRAERASAKLDTVRARIPEIAHQHGMSAAALEGMMRRDRDLWLDEGARLFYACEGLEVPAFASAAEMAPVGAAAASSVPNSTDVFKLHSLPGASRVIYLDFNGHTTRGTQWNVTKTGGADIVSAPFDMDGNPAAFSAAETDRIKRIWQRVAEDFSPFAINVTTEEPAADALRRIDANDTTYGVRVVISPTSSWYGSAGGVAYVGSFLWNSDTPAFVFADRLGPNHEKYVAEAISHETGHTFGLSHDGKSDGTSYYAGHGSWAPIMGVGYYKPVTQWSRGEYASANNLEDDYAKISANGGPVSTDDYGNDLTTAEPLAGPSVLTYGLIESRTDVDVFRLACGSGAVSFSAAGPSVESNVDLKLELLSATGVVLASSDPTGLSASVSVTVAAGTYYLRLQGVGAGDAVTTGYSDYGSIGEYRLSGSFAAAAVHVKLGGFDGSFEGVTHTRTGYHAFTYRPILAPFVFVADAGIAANGCGFTASNPVAPSGTQVAFIQKTGRIELTLPYPAGTYKINARVANRANVTAKQTVDVLIDGQAVGSFSGTRSYAAVSSSTFVVTEGVHTLTLAGRATLDATLLLDLLEIERVN